MLSAGQHRVPHVHDNNQHGANENVRLQNLSDGVEVYAGLMTGMARPRNAVATSRN